MLLLLIYSLVQTFLILRMFDSLFLLITIRRFCSDTAKSDEAAEVGSDFWGEWIRHEQTFRWYINNKGILYRIYLLCHSLISMIWSWSPFVAMWYQKASLKSSLEKQVKHEHLMRILLYSTLLFSSSSSSSRSSLRITFYVFISSWNRMYHSALA